AQAFSMSVDYNVAAPLRLEAIRMLRGTTFQFTDLADWFLTLLDGRESPAINSAAITTLASYSDPRILTTLMARWSALTPTLTPDSRKQVVAALLGRVERLNSVLDEIENGRIRPDDLTSTEINMLRTDSDQGVRQRALRLFGQLTPHRPAVLDSFSPA